jgi:hypothetical protein
MRCQRRNRWRSTGVRPLGAQVRRTTGVNDWPLSSRKTIHAPRRRALLPDPGPVLLDPTLDGGLITLGRATSRPLHAPAHLPQHPPHMGRVMAHPGQPFDDHRDPPKGPQVGVELVRTSAFEQGALQLPALGPRQLGTATRPPGRSQRRPAALLPAGCQRLTFCREVPSRRTTSPCEAPCSNMRAACRRTRSIALKSRRPAAAAREALTAMIASPSFYGVRRSWQTSRRPIPQTSLTVVC